MQLSRQPSAPGSYVARVLSITLDSAMIVAALEVLGLLIRIPGTRTLSSAMLLSLGAFGAGVLVTLPAALWAAVSFRNQRMAQQLGALWLLLGATVSGFIAYSQRDILFGLARDYGWMRVAGVVGLLFVTLGLPASFLARHEVLRRRTVSFGLAAALAMLIASGLGLGLEVFVRMQPPLHAFLGFASATCVVLVRVLLHRGHRPPWLAGVALAGGVALMLPAIKANHVVHAHAAHRGLLLADLLHIIHPGAKPLPSIPIAPIARPSSRPLDVQPRLVVLVTIDSCATMFPNPLRSPRSRRCARARSNSPLRGPPQDSPSLQSTA